jgi:membrane protein
LLLGATGVVIQLKDALNTVWETETPASSGVWGFVRNYIVSLAGVLGLGFLLLVSLLLTTALSAGANLLTPFLPEAVLQIFGLIIGFCRRQRAVRYDVQMASGHRYRLARCLAWRRRHRSTV